MFQWYSGLLCPHWYFLWSWENQLCLSLFPHLLNKQKPPMIKTKKKRGGRGEVERNGGGERKKRERRKWWYLSLLQGSYRSNVILKQWIWKFLEIFKCEKKSVVNVRARFSPYLLFWKQDPSLHYSSYIWMWGPLRPPRPAECWSMKGKKTVWFKRLSSWHWFKLSESDTRSFIFRHI